MTKVIPSAWNRTMYRRLADFIVVHRQRILVIIGLVFLGCLALAPSLDFNFTPQQLFKSSGDDHEYREVFAERFGREDNLVTILVAGDDLYSPQNLGPLRDLTYELRFHPDITEAQSVATMALPRPESLSARPHLGDLSSLIGDGELQRPVRGPPVTTDQAAQLADYVGDEPMIEGRLINDDATVAMIVAWVDPDIQQVRALSEVVKSIESLASEYEFGPQTTVRVEGIPALRVTIVESLRQEQLTFVPITAFIFFLILMALFRRPSGVILPLGTVVFALVATIAMLVLTDSSINIINNVLPTLIFVIGISDSIHMITRHTEEVAVGKSRDEAVRAMIRHTGAACLLTSTTTAVGFLSLLSANTSILMNFGWQAAAGVLFAYLGTLFLLPAGLTYLKPARRGKKRRTKDDSPPLLERLLMMMGRRLLAHPWTVLAIALTVAGAIAVQGYRVEIDTTILEVFGEDHPTFQSMTTIEDELGGLLPFEISLESQERDRFKNPDVYAAVHDIQTYAAAQPNVLSTESYVDYLQVARVAITGDRQQRDELPENIAQLEQLLLIVADAPDTRGGLNNFVTSDFRNARILVRVADSGAKSHLRLANALEAEIEEQFSQLPGIEARITGDAYVASAALDSFIHDLLMSLIIAIVVIFLMMTVVFRSLKIGLISLLPNALPLLITYGYMGYAGINLNTTTIIIFAISLGIAVDDAIHFFARFVEERQKTKDLKQAILRTYFGAGRAILLTSLLLVIGMTVLTLSDFVPTSQFGLLTGITIASAVLADLIILPPLLYIVYSRFPDTTKRTLVSDISTADGDVNQTPPPAG